MENSYAIQTIMLDSRLEYERLKSLRHDREMGFSK